MGKYADEEIEDAMFGNPFDEEDRQEWRKTENKRRIEYAKKKFTELKITFTIIGKKEIQFNHKDELIKFFPYTGWHTGKSITDGRGIENLLKQLK